MKGRVGRRAFDFKGLRPREGDILVIKKWKGYSSEDHAAIMKVLEDNIKPALTVFFVNSLSDIKLISERQLNAIGLGRLPDTGTDVPESTPAES